MVRARPTPTLFPYTTLFRSEGGLRGDRSRADPGLPCRGCARLPRRRRARCRGHRARGGRQRSEEHTSELQSLTNLVCRLLLEKKKTTKIEEWKQAERKR